ncbi:hypothetical protein MBFIL_00460 [Methanobrevibacter filiformis]|uniref:Uncharacterized protein n=1 Tax=Methanobrevibacter filiformis TaxID=55758 RepID=A0A166CYV4_9EURY|nr:hypothetical protein MBFIL_00460 [Methanobrevibacter filiformis]
MNFDLILKEIKEKFMPHALSPLQTFICFIDYVKILPPEKVNIIILLYIN